MTDPLIVEQVTTPTGRDQDQIEYFATNKEGVQVTEKMRQFLGHVVNGTLPTMDVPEVAPEVRELAEELAVVHLPEWKNPAGRKLAEPAVIQVAQAPRIADYLIQRGWRRDPALEVVRWSSTPGGLPGPYDTGLHYGRGEDGEWPIPDIEAYWDVDDVKTEQLPDGTWKAEHPRGVAFQAATKSEALAGIVETIRTKIEEAKDALDR
ncbi:hypothetical protein ACFWPK_04265 [Nocardia sp. NPDC058519]|uniref:hypothetical protein n=1 Tax=Nocardia sp. NPDC058519 TaxID=3346535 RepID=UPI00366118FE